jgi:excisionase family DNA binding protein
MPVAVELQLLTITCKCGVDAPEGAKFCFACGKRLPKPKLLPPEIEAHVIRQVDPVLKHAEACKFLKCSAWMLYELGNESKIPFFKVGNRRRYYTQDLIDWMRRLDGPITTA